MKKIFGILPILLAFGVTVPGMAETETDTYSMSSSTQMILYYGPESEVVIPTEYEGTAALSFQITGSDTAQNMVSCEVPEGIISLWDLAFSGCVSLKEVSLPESLRIISTGSFRFVESMETLDIPAGVEYIGSEAFMYCKSLTSITFHGNVPVMGLNLFEGCDSLETIYVPDNLMDAYRSVLPDTIEVAGNGEEAAEVSKEVSSEDFKVDAETGTLLGYYGDDVVLEIPESIDGVEITAIGERCFLDCRYLAAVTIPEGVTEIGERAFVNTDSLRKVELPETLEIIGPYAFHSFDSDGPLELPASLKSIEDGAFSSLSIYDPDDRSELVIPEQITVITPESFSYMSVQQVYMPAGIERIEEKAFEGSYTSYMRFEGYEPPQVDETAFSPYYLRDIDLPWDISREAWERWKSAFEPIGFEDLTIWRNNPTAFGLCENADFDNGGMYEDGYLTEYTGTLESVSVYSSYDSIEVVGLGERVFADNKTIRKFYPHHCEWFTTIGNEAFADSSLEYIEMFDSITTIGEGAFRNCTELTEIILPPYLTYVGEGAFDGCTGLTKVEIQCDASILPAGLFDECTALSQVILSEGVMVTPELIGENVDVRAADGCSDEYLEELNESMQRRWYNVILREGETSSLITMPFDPNPESDFTIDSETGIITEYLGTAVDVVVPREIDGVTVTGIGYGAFSACEDYTDTEMMSDQTEWVPMRTLVLPETVRTIADSSFNYCQQLELFICYGPLETTGRGTFIECRNLKNAIFVNGVAMLDNYSFNGASSLEYVYCGNVLEQIGDGVFDFSGLQDEAAG